MTKLHAIATAVLLSLMVLACGDSAPQRTTEPPADTPTAVVAPEPATQIEGWWERGDAAGPFTAELRGGDILSVDRDLSHGDYGSSRDRFEFESGRLVHYTQNAELRLMDSDDPTRLVPVEMRLDFDGSGELTEGEKSIDGEQVEVEAGDVDRVLAQVDDLVEQTQIFAHVYAAGGEPVEYRCPNDQTFSVTYGRNAVVLDLGPGSGRHVLDHQAAGSGAKYGGETYVFWSKGDEALVERFGERWLNGCVAQN
ncbi:MAG: MliC family protein [Holophagae bacterium]|jgi:membrane-bound inhibitor of C-type lysozyme